ncbi:polysaccharide deacetylase family protein [Microbacterium trichothecenolyticum]|uniref:Peptidoglycan/xylan/chitin deacetylase (PgdA/CDA1 family) n=1 Tax=Microbacterium trichothecenolyticum TaxID=69370 RepID=A0ABU0TTT7_MICTR|nr:polysaccharide deacetylase family protein [Microbacterium trichothecenolyticum]MDQ1123078.1 peptidoglycan/xylan/chitin deacetylase (PgdA/CDA1 family) [Microbacterium trichothecenolyticum]
MRRTLAIAAALAVTIALAGCMPESDPDWMPRGWGAGDLRTVEAPPVPIAAGQTPGLAGERVRSDLLGLQARVMVVPGAEAIGAAVLQPVRAAIAARSAAVNRAYAPEVFGREAGLNDRGCVQGSTLRPAAEAIADPALGPIGGSGTAVLCDIVVAAGSVIGQRVRTIEAPGGVPTADHSEVLFADVTTGEVAGARGLWNADAASALWAESVDLLRREAGALSLAPVAPPDDSTAEAFATVLDSTLPAPDGSFVVTLPAGFTAPALTDLGAPPTATDRFLAVPPARVGVLASPLGVAVSAALAAGTPFAPPPSSPSRTGSTDCRLVPCVALTFDDGPGPFTPGIMDALEAQRSAATFYAIGRNVAGGADTVRRAVADGHEVGNHTWSHPQLPTLDAAAVGRQIRDTQNALREATGVTPTSFRPPYGEYDAAVLTAAGLPAVLWDVDTNDWRQPDQAVLIGRAVEQPRPGSIVLLHDIHENTARATPAIISGLRDRGFTLVTVTELFGGTMPSKGAWRSAR